MPVPPAPGCGFPPDWGGGTGAGGTDTHDAFDGPDSSIRYLADNTFPPDGPLPGTRVSSFAVSGYARGMNTPMSSSGGITVAGPVTPGPPTKAGPGDGGGTGAEPLPPCNPICPPPQGEKVENTYCDLMGSDVSFLKLAKMFSLGANEKDYGQLHCLIHCLLSGLLIDREWGDSHNIGVYWEYLEHKAYDVANKLFGVTPLPLTESIADITFYNRKGIICAQRGHRSLRDCWCCCCKLLFRKPCKKRAWL